MNSEIVHYLEDIYEISDTIADSEKGFWDVNGSNNLHEQHTETVQLESNAVKTLAYVTMLERFPSPTSTVARSNIKLENGK